MKKPTFLIDYAHEEQTLQWIDDVIGTISPPEVVELRNMVRADIENGAGTDSWRASQS